MKRVIIVAVLPVAIFTVSGLFVVRLRFDYAVPEAARALAIVGANKIGPQSW